MDFATAYLIIAGEPLRGHLMDVGEDVP